MQEFRDGNTQNFIQVNMFACIGEPLFSSNNVRYFHFPIINHIGEMECRPAVFLNDHKIIKFNKWNNPKILVNKYRRDFEKIASNSDSIRLAFENSVLNLLKSQSGAFSIVWSRIGFSLLIFFIVFRCFEFLLFLCFTVRLHFAFMRAKARVGKIIFEQYFFHIFVEWNSLALNVWSKFLIWIQRRLVGVDVEPFQSVKDVLHRALNVAILKHLTISTWSVSSMRMMNLPWDLMAKSLLKRAVLSPPKCIIPVGEGAYLTLTENLKSNEFVSLNMCNFIGLTDTR